MNQGPTATATIELSLWVTTPEGVLIDDGGRVRPFSGWIELASAIEDWRLAWAEVRNPTRGQPPNGEAHDTGGTR